MSLGLLMLLTFTAVLLAVAGAYSIVTDLLRDQSRVSRRVDEEFRKRQRDRAQASALFKDLGTLPADLWGENEDRPTLGQRFEALIEQSGLDVPPRRVLTFIVAGGVALGALVGLLGQSLFYALPGAALGAAVPFLYVYFKRRARLNKLMAQLPDAFDLMARVIRAGQTMSQALQAIADEFDQPISAEFAFCYEQQNLGLSPELALRDLARRTGLLEVKIFVLAILVQQQTGGNLAELLDKLATVIRERSRVQGKIRALTAEGRFQAVILLALPPLLFLLMLFFNRNYGQVLLDRPGVLGSVCVAEFLGAVWIRRIVNFDF
jgi:tight adherence protein B